MATGVRAAEHDLPPVPKALLEAVGEARRELTAAASGRVLVVPEAGAESALESEQASGARYDTILSFLCTPGVADLEGFAAALEQVLADEGWIFMVELAAAGTDVVSVVRSRGLFVTDLYRREAPSAPAGWRRYVVLKARRESPRRADQ